jgi:hypothetical protein
VRLATGIDDEAFITAFSTTIKERLTQGGASGAFFFFSKGERFIAKSCTMQEMETLKTNAKAYADYMVANKNSYISKVPTRPSLTPRPYLTNESLSFSVSLRYSESTS